jgi:hypothetical protein
MTRTVINTAGEPEREARSPRANAIEALLVIFVVLATLWPFCFGLGVLQGNAAISQAAHWPLIAVFAWVFVGSPLWHRDSAESLGLGNPRRLWRMLRDGSPAQRLRLIVAMGVVFDALVFIGLNHWREVVRFFKLPHSAVAWPAPTVIGFVFLLTGFIVTCLIRYDNFGSAFRAAVAVSASLIGFAGAAAGLHRGWSVFAEIEPGQYVLDVIAYVFWGFLQQAVFTAYFSTRLRKGFPPAPQLIVPPERRPRLMATGAVATAATLAPGLWLLVRSLYGAAAAPFAMLAWCVVFALPVGAAWMWFYCRDPRRMLIATLSGAVFGLIHIDSYGLVLVTFGLGTILAWLFMEDRTRNLTALGFIHGFLGSTFGKLFKGNAAGALHVDYRVGPWNVVAFIPHVLIVPLICLAGLLVLTWWCWRRLPAASLAPAATSCSRY